MGSANSPEDDLLLYRVRVAAAVVTVALLAIVVLTERDATTVGLVAGALFVLLGIAGTDYFFGKRNGNGR